LPGFSKYRAEKNQIPGIKSLFFNKLDYLMDFCQKLWRTPFTLEYSRKNN